jgi:hypothetical protein
VSPHNYLDRNTTQHNTTQHNTTQPSQAQSGGFWLVDALDGFRTADQQPRPVFAAAPTSTQQLCLEQLVLAVRTPSSPQCSVFVNHVAVFSFELCRKVVVCSHTLRCTGVRTIGGRKLHVEHSCAFALALTTGDCFLGGWGRGGDCGRLLPRVAPHCTPPRFKIMLKFV